MTEQGAIAELSAQADWLENTLLYYEENAPGRNNGAIESYKQAVEIAIDTLEEILKYHKIGTLEEFRKLKELQVARKPRKESDRYSDLVQHYYCPSCGRYFGQAGVRNAILFEKERYCQDEDCGQKLDWSDED